MDEPINILDYTSHFEMLEMMLNDTNEILRFILSILIFFVIVLLCRYTYKFFKIFF